MIYLLLSILSSTGIFLIFRLIDRRNVKTFPVIVVNYVTAASLGFALNGGKTQNFTELVPCFYLLALLIGILFILMFFVVARSSQKAGMAVTTIAGKMSVIFPITFSLLYDPADVPGLMKAAGILLALPGVLLTIFKRREKMPDPSTLYLPLILFAGMGLVDSLVKLSQYEFITDSKLSFFTGLLFAISGLCGILVSLSSRTRLLSLFNLRVLAWGIVLGFVNFGSIYFFVRTLNYRYPGRGAMDSSVVFGINNIGIVTLSILLGVLLFRERLSRTNLAGIVLCLAATVLLAYSSG